MASVYLLMKMENKNKEAFLFSILLCVLVYALGSCTGDNDFIGSDDLSLNMQIPMTRSTNPESPQEILTEEQRKKKQRETPVYDDECGLLALTEVKKRNGNVFTDGDPNNTAAKYYERMREYGREACNYDKGAMTASTMLTIGQKYDLLTGMVDFRDGISPIDYFANKENRKNARIVCFQKDGQGHYAKVDRTNMKTGKVFYTDSTGTHEVEMDQIEGVLYYDK